MNSNYKLDIPYIAGLFDAMGKKYWRWQCLDRNCFFIARLLWAHVNVKLHKIEQIIDYYEPDIQDVNDNLVDLALERKKRR